LDINRLKELFLDPRLDYFKIILLFGSRAMHLEHEKSDYDFAVYTEKKFDNPWGDSAKFWNDFSDILPLHECDYDIVDLRSATKELKHSIEEGYILLKGKEDELQRVLAKNERNC